MRRKKEKVNEKAKRDQKKTDQEQVNTEETEGYQEIPEDEPKKKKKKNKKLTKLVLKNRKSYIHQNQ